GGDLKQRFVALDLVTRLLQPFGDGPFEDRFAHLGHDYVGGHEFLPKDLNCSREQQKIINHLRACRIFAGKRAWAILAAVEAKLALVHSAALEEKLCNRSGVVRCTPDIAAE